MNRSRSAVRPFLLLALAAWICAPLEATTLIRQGLDELVASNQSVVVGKVIDATSYWNDNKTFILTDVTIAPDETIKGTTAREITVTLLGGKIGDLTTLIVGGAKLIPGRSYVLFLNPEKLPGSRQVLTVPGHSQGAFEITLREGKLRAVSQASRQPLLADSRGRSDAPGGAAGIPLETLLANLRDTVKRQEVRR